MKPSATTFKNLFILENPSLPRPRRAFSTPSSLRLDFADMKRFFFRWGWGIVFVMGFPCVSFSQYDFGFSVDTEMANSVNEGNIPPESQSFVTIEQNWAAKDNKTKALFQARLMNNSYEIEKLRFNNSEIYPVDTYVEFLPSSQRITLGYQHIFLTEGFDTVGMELINPRNQNTSFFLDADKKFYTVPAINYRYISDFLTVQLLHVFQYRSDEANSYLLNRIQASVPGLDIQKVESKDRMKKNDQTLRLLKSIGSFDLGLSYLKTYDKTNQYQLNLQTFKMDQKADDFVSYSFNASGDLSGTVLRLDYLVSQDRKTVMTNGEYKPVNYQNYNLGVEHDFIYSSQIALNYSKSDVQTDLTPTFRKKNIEDFYVRWEKTFFDTFKLEMLLLYRLSDKGQAVNLKVAYPLSSLINVKAGLETFGGDPASEFTLIKDFSRVYVGLYSTVF